jgi:hypothetical protein
LPEKQPRTNDFAIYRLAGVSSTNGILAIVAGTSTRLLGCRPIAKLLNPIVVLGIAKPEGEHRVGQLPPLPITGMDPDQKRSVATALNIPRLKFRGLHGVMLLEGKG